MFQQHGFALTSTSVLASGAVGANYPMAGNKDHIGILAHSVAYGAGANAWFIVGLTIKLAQLSIRNGCSCWNLAQKTPYPVLKISTALEKGRGRQQFAFEIIFQKIFSQLADLGIPGIGLSIACRAINKFQACQTAVLKSCLHVAKRGGENFHGKNFIGESRRYNYPGSLWGMSYFQPSS